MTQELPKKHNEAGPPEQLPSDALSQFDNGHTRHWRLLVPTNNAKGTLKICVWLRLWKISTPTFQNAPPPLLYESILSVKSCNMDISCTGKPFLTLVIRFRRCESFLNGIFVSIFHTWRTYPRYSVWLARSDKNSATSRVPPGAPLSSCHATPGETSSFLLVSIGDQRIETLKTRMFST